MALTELQIRKLSRIQGRATLYEVALVKGDQKLLLCYTRKTGRGLGDYVRNIRNNHAASADVLKARTGIDLQAWNWNGWGYEFTGRTQREAIIDGELPFWGRPEPAVKP